jgi:uncharacterized protein (TIGR03083 family)
MGERGLREPVPACEGWDVGELVWHVAGVYEHKVRVMADKAWPQDWPPAGDFDDDDEIAFLRAAKAHLFEEFARHELDEDTVTFGADSTIAFWVRRMACEVAVHRYDGEEAHGQTTPIPDDLAIDGVDEMLRVMLAGPWWQEKVQTAHPVDALVGFEVGGRRWLCDVREKSATVSEDDSGTAATSVSGTPMAVFLWLWGRISDEAVTVSGDAATGREIRARLAECSG